MKKLKNLQKKVITSLTTACPFLFTANAYASGIIGGALTDAAEKASGGIQDEALGILPYVLIVLCLIGGFTLIVMGRKGRELVKDQAIPTIIGIAMVVCAGGIAGWMFGLFN